MLHVRISRRCVITGNRSVTQTDSRTGCNRVCTTSLSAGQSIVVLLRRSHVLEASPCGGTKVASVCEEVQSLFCRCLHIASSISAATVAEARTLPTLKDFLRGFY